MGYRRRSFRVRPSRTRRSRDEDWLRSTHRATRRPHHQRATTIATTTTTPHLRARCPWAFSSCTDNHHNRWFRTHEANVGSGRVSTAHGKESSYREQVRHVEVEVGSSLRKLERRTQGVHALVEPPDDLRRPAAMSSSARGKEQTKTKTKRRPAIR